MQHKLLFTCFFLILLTACNAQRREANVYPVAFYNLENLFDTDNDPNTDDDDFTPQGSMHYTNTIYRQRLHNMATVLQVIGDDKNKDGFALLGVAEVENDKVLNDLLSQPEVSNRRYKYVWYNSADPRGIDVALIYNPAYFTVINSKPLPVRLNGLGGKEDTRHVLYVQGVLGKDTVHVLVNHWPSRREGEESVAKRAAAAMVDADMIRNIKANNATAKIIVMGDLNDNPADASVTDVLGAGNTKSSALYNPWVEVLQSGRGTEVFQRHWNLFDQIIISNNLHYAGCAIEDRDFMTFSNRNADRYPRRAFRGFFWNNGYSDHFPVVLYLNKK